jgi:DnaK suppressor protein
MINKSDLTRITESLINERDQIQKSLSNIKRDDPFSNPERVNDNANSGTDAFEESEHLRLEVQEETLVSHLSDITKGLSRIESKTYGICTSCNKLINIKRLLANPSAIVCISCEKKRNP